MKILFHHRIASRDGQAVHIEELIEALRAQGHEVVLVGPELRKTNFGGASGFVELIKKGLPASVYELLEIAYNVVAFIRLDRAIRVHDPDVIYERFSLFLLAGILACRLHGVPRLLEVNGPLFEERTANDNLALRSLGRWCQRWSWRSADRLLPVTRVLADIVRGYGVPDDQIEVIPNGINPDRFSTVPATAMAKAALGYHSGIVLGFTGFMRRWHALDRVIDFIADQRAHFDLHFLVVGDGPSREAVANHAKVRKAETCLTITGVVQRDEIANYIAAFDIALQPGLPEYASPLKLFEYMYLSRAIVAPSSPNICEVLTDGHDALLFDPTVSGSMESAVLRLCNDVALRTRLGAQARRTIDNKALTWANNAKRVIALGEAVALTKGTRTRTGQTKLGA